MSAPKRTSIVQQEGAISRFLMKFGNRRPSEAAMEVTSMSAARRRRWFKVLQHHGCIEWRDPTMGQYAARWYVVKDLPASEGEPTNG